MKSPHRVTVIIPAWNASATIRDCIASFLSQSLRPDEIIIVDDGSSDGTPDIVRSIDSGETRIQLISIHDNRGAAYARNIGIKAAREGIICFGESDGKYSFTYIKKCVDALLTGGERVFASGGLRFCWRENDTWADFWDVLCEARWYLLKTGRVKPIGGWVFYKRSLCEIGYYNETLSGGEDTELAFRLQRTGHRLVWVPNVFFTHAEPQSIQAVWKRFFSAGKSTVFYRLKRGSLLKDSLLSTVLIIILLSFPVNICIVPLLIIVNTQSRIGLSRMLKKKKRNHIPLSQCLVFPYRYFFVKCSVAVGLICGVLSGGSKNN